ncbi:MAG: Zn-ribbon domain-containing OB-fold protein [Burkholderiales bacterium]
MTPYTKPLPKIDDANAPHWQGAKAHEVRVQKCLGCGTLRYPPARQCAQCLAEKSEWVTLAGTGEVWSHGTFHRAYFKGFEHDLPYTVVLVKLDEGAMLYSNLVGIPRDDVRIGMRVRAVFDDVTDEIALIKFIPDGSVR